MASLYNWTPTFYSNALSQHCKKDIWLKMECFQPTGSFKIRGIGHLCQHYAKQGAKGFVSSSGGNAGIAVSYAGKQLNINVDVFIPNTSHQIYIDMIKSYGANVHIKGDVWDEAHKAALEFAHTTKAEYIHPFDDPLIWEGHATMIDEVAQQGITPDASIVAVGGGGLACGVLQGMTQNGWQQTPLITVETAGAASFYESVKADKLITLEKVNTVATSLGAKRITQQLFDWTKKHSIQPITVSDETSVIAVKKFLDDQRAFVEVSAGAALSLVYDKHPILDPYNSILVIVCGGVGISQKILKDFMHKLKISETG